MGVSFVGERDVGNFVGICVGISVGKLVGERAPGGDGGAARAAGAAEGYWRFALARGLGLGFGRASTVARMAAAREKPSWSRVEGRPRWALVPVRPARQDHVEVRDGRDGKWESRIPARAAASRSARRAGAHWVLAVFRRIWRCQFVASKAQSSDHFPTWVDVVLASRHRCRWQAAASSNRRGSAGTA